MLTEIDRVQLATPDADEAARKWQRLLGAEEIQRDKISCLGAKRVTLRAGASDIEILEPDGAGTIESELRRRGRAHLFAAGASSPDPARVVSQAQARGATHVAENGRHYLTIIVEGAPIRFVISPMAAREPVGDLDFLYEVTLLAADQAGAVREIRDSFGLDDAHFTTITSEHFGYTGVLTLFREGALHRFEVITPLDKHKTMGRYHAREGASFYMAFAESARMVYIEGEAKKTDAGITVDRPEGRFTSRTADQLWLHPASLGGMMLGVSRPSMAWRWSGHPERVVSIA
jgi:catechol 2,3-dioxygenase-like lactoylglutathione lyase family enzyme